jgi:hypothetical protein
MKAAVPRRPAIPTNLRRLSSVFFKIFPSV